MNERELKALLATRPREDLAFLTLRAALRVLPSRLENWKYSRRRKTGEAGLLELKLLLMAAVALKFSKPDFCQFDPGDFEAAEYADTIFSVLGSIVKSNSVEMFDSNFIQRIADTFDVFYRLSYSAEVEPKMQTSAGDQGKGSAIHAFEQDMGICTAGKHDLNIALWHGQFLPYGAHHTEAEAFSLLAEEIDDPHSFWRRWYSSAVSGKWIDWDLQRDVALIPASIWRRGHKAVAQEIAIIEERHDLRSQVKALRQQLETLLTSSAKIASAETRSHNSPPEVIDGETETRRRIASLVQTLVDTEAELAKAAPERSRLRALAEALRDGVLAILRYCGGLADTAAEEAAKSVGKWAGAAATVYFGSEPVLKGVAKIAETILVYTSRLP